MHLDDLSKLIDRARQNGATQLSTICWEWDISGNCTDPVPVEKFERAERSKFGNNARATIVVGLGASRNSLWLIMQTRCRKCASCLDYRQRVWTAKALTEHAYSSRTWFGTLTLRPEVRFILTSQARSRCARNGEDFDRLNNQDRYAAYWRELASELTKYVKRVRKASGSPFRIFIIGEPHKDGTPHVHFLFFEQQEGTLMKKHIRGKWNLGFSHCKLVWDKSNVFYVAKYLGKTVGTRIRASIRFGRSR